MSFRNNIFEISLFLPEAAKIDFEMLNVHLTLRPENGTKTTKIGDRVFLATRIAPWPNISKIIGHTWK
jgi:hypothetical protein